MSKLLQEISFTLNGKHVRLITRPTKSLARILREDLGITSVKIGCEEGECGSCTVIVNGKPVPSCLMIASQIVGKDVYTIEGLKEDPIMKSLVSSFIEKETFQCGICAPGVIITSYSLVRETIRLSSKIKRRDLRSLIAEKLSGNLCRCGSYLRIIASIEDALSKQGVLAD
ncbi:MAG TPA: (2Fe-2S)-binding protein [Sulfolobales archaeon]|nr:(2Fe-2S)-binding protein [Sulfolobales archaeon]